MRIIIPLSLLLMATTVVPAQDPPANTERVLPGIRKDGFVQLPNQWKLNPVGRHIEVGDTPMNVQIHPTGQFAAILHCGYKEHEVVVIDLNPAKRKIVSRVIVDQAFYGLAFSSDGKQVYASGGEFDLVHVWDFDKGLLHNHRTIDLKLDKGRAVPGGLVFDKAGKDLFVAATWADAVVRVPLDNPANKVMISMKSSVKKAVVAGQGDAPSPPDNRKDPNAPKEVVKDEGIAKDANSYPYTVLVDGTGKKLFVSLWAEAAVAVVDLETNTVVTQWASAEHPTEMVLTPDGKTLYVACANSTKVSVFDTGTGTVIQTIHCALYPQAPNGNTPTSLCLTPDGQMLFVANADANNLAVFNVADAKLAKPLGFIPTAWYPTSVRYNPLDKTIYVANAKGMSSKPNMYGSNPNMPAKTLEYIGSLFKGTFTAIPMPSPNQMAAYTKTAFECSPLQAANVVNAKNVAAGNPIPLKLGDPSPIKYCIYVIKENRTYDQVFGDMPQGNGSKELCLFPEAITPNHHKLSRDYVLLDNFYVEGEVSADGHEWTMGAYATDFVEKMWPLSYRGSPNKTFGYPSEGQMDKPGRPSGGYLWDKAIEKNVSVYSFGEWIENAPLNADGTFADGKATVKALVGRFDPQFRSYDLDVKDQKRADRYITKLAEFEKAGEMPRLQIVKLPNDHTSGTRVGKPTPTAMVADNDLALGRIVEAVSKSKFWKETAIFVIEDDAQNGPDHVDAHRSVALVISPYTKKKFVDSTLYSTSSMLRSMELILGLNPMSQFDAAARPMYNSFQATPDAAPYSHVVPKTDLNAVNRPGAFGAAISEKFDLTKEDLADDLLFNEVIWRSVKGPRSKMPAPVRAAFFVPVKAKRD